jgi:hypothetical protein
MSILRTAIVVLLMQVQPAPAFLQGIVTNQSNGDPLPRATLELRKLDAGNAPPYIATSDRDGQFVFRNIPPGRYQLSAIRADYVNVSGLSITLDPGQRVAGLRLAMTQTGVVSGRITTQFGQPLGNADVQAVKVGYRDGQRVLVAVKSARTNDLGEYRLFWLPPGTYYVNVLAAGNRLFVVNGDAIGNPPSQMMTSTQYVAKRPPMGRLGEREADVPVYFPGTPDGQAALPVSVRAAEEVRGIDIVANPVTTPRMRGKVINSLTGQPEPGAQIQIAPLNPFGGSPAAGYSGAVNAVDGSFEIPKVVPGPYVVAALVQGRVAARAQIDVRNVDVTVSLTTQREITLPGRILMDGQPVGANTPISDEEVRRYYDTVYVPNARQRGAASIPAFPLVSQQLRSDIALSRGVISQLSVTLQPYPPIPGALVNSNVARALQSAANAVVAADGSFQLRQISPGDYRVAVGQGVQLPNAYLKSIRLGAADLLNDPLRIERQPDGQIEIVLGTRPGEVSGRVLNDRQEPVPAVSVVLVPNAGRAFRADLFEVTSTDVEGRFRLQGIPPGDYKVFAWEDVEVGAWQDPDFLRSQEDRGRAVRIEEGTLMNLEISPIR